MNSAANATEAPDGKRLSKPQLPVLQEWMLLSGILTATFLTYISTIGFGWVYDDPPQIPQNPNLQWSRFGFLFTHQLWASNGLKQGRFYRPLLTVWFLINKSIFGLNPHWFHVTTILAHVAATFLAYFIARSILENAPAALFAAAIFGLHPLQTEAASWISAVNDPLAAVFCFASFLLCRRARQTREHSAAYWTLAGFFFLLALLTKEVSVVLPGIVFVDLLVGRKDDQPTTTRRFPFAAFAAFASLTIPWVAVRAVVLGQPVTGANLLAWPTVLLSAPKVLLFDLYHAIVPVGLSIEYDVPLIVRGNAEFFAILLALIILATIAVAAARRNSRLWVAYAWIVLPLLPTLNLAWMNEDDFVHDRYMYMSMLGIALLAGAAYAVVSDWIREKAPTMKLIPLLAACLLVTLAFASAIQSEYWANDVVLFGRGVSRSPQSEWAQLNYGAALSARGKYGDAASHFVRSYELKPGCRAADFAGFAYQQSGNLPEAERWFNQALKFDSSLANAWFGLAQVALSQHVPAQSILFLRKALELDPSAEGYHYALGSALEQASQPNDAIAEYKTELQLHPYQTGARKALDRLQSPTRSSAR